MSKHYHIQKQSSSAHGRRTDPPTPGHGLYLVIEHNHSEAGIDPNHAGRYPFHEHGGLWGCMHGTREDADKMEAFYRQHVASYIESKRLDALRRVV